ncbi:MAG TPA: zinc-ribbon domain-containing protein [Geobacteraceae bacterium]|nr:zinc-ribbon domain-containing protein [Geobacteraceae bacterium]
MSMLTVSCPFCGFARQLPSEQVPDGPHRVTCPRCKEVFLYTKPIPPGRDDNEAEPGSAGSGSSALSVPPSFPPVSPDSDSAGAQDQDSPLLPPAAALTEVGELFRQSWELFQHRFAPLILLYLLTLLAVFVPVVVTTVLSFLASGLFGSPVLFILIPFGVIAGLICALWCYGGFLCALVDDTLPLERALSRGKEVMLPLAWVFLLNGFVVIGGYVLFIIPGIIFTVWFFFGQFILPAEGMHGMEALLKSREYVRGQWLNVALRLLLIWAVSVVVGAVPFFGPVLSFLFFPFLMIFHYLIYRDLRALKRDIPWRCDTKDKLVWPGVALLGWLLVPILLLFFAGSLFDGKHRKTPSVEALVVPGTVLKVPARGGFKIQDSHRVAG